MEKKYKNPIIEIIEMQEKILSSEENEKARNALQGAIDFKTKSGIRYITYQENGDNILCLINTEDNSTIQFKVESVIGGINHENFHPEQMFQNATITP